MKRVTALTLILFLISLSLFLRKDSLVSFLNKRLFSQLNELASEAYVEFIQSQTGEGDPLALEGDFHGQKFLTPQRELTEDRRQILGTETINPEEKWIEIDLSEQRLFAHEGEKIVYNFLVSTGKWAPTPKGEFRIWIKLRYTPMKGGDKALGTYYYLPNVPYTMYFYKGYGIHGTYWHNNFGQPMSHGCVNLSISDAEKLFFWARPKIDPGKSVAYPTTQDSGTRVVIHD